MSDRSFFTYEGREYGSPGFEDKAMAELTSHQVGAFAVEATQHYAWVEELRILGDVCVRHPDAVIALEYMIPRMGKRVDAMVLCHGHVLIIEFKVGEKAYPADALAQVEDYAFDLRSFHGDSHDRTMFPIVVCTKAASKKNAVRIEDGICETCQANEYTLADVVDACLSHSIDDPRPLEPLEWLNAEYQPTPTIIEAARALYEHNTVEDISRNEAGITNISTTTACVDEIIKSSREHGRKSICFVTGVPGAGKTLVGLNIASMRRRDGTTSDDETAVFLSGNGPLIEVLQASLVEDQLRRQDEECRACKAAGTALACRQCPRKKSKTEVRAEVKSFVQGVHLFREELFKSDSAPFEHIAVFDEAQRAWTEQQLTYKMGTRRQNKRVVHKSEPQCLIEYMDRHEDWACMVCLVGGGQEIHQGEAGIIEWFRALEAYFPDWDVYAADSIRGENYLGSQELESICTGVVLREGLHLSVDMRSFRNKNVAAFAEAIVSNRPEVARDLYASIVDDYPIYVTRDLQAAKEWVREVTRRPSDRYGVVADSYGQRIRADGISVPMEFDAVKWFLRGRDEVDSSYYMEIAASEFKIQGLEIDYAVVAWEGDYRYAGGEFGYHRFAGGKWQNVNNEMRKRYLKNGYRVLLTRARQGYVIYVPKGSVHDPTRPPSYYDETYRYLRSVGIKELDER